MRRKQQIQAMQQELALLRQTIDSGKELAALAAGAAPRSARAGPPPSGRSAPLPRATGFTRPLSRRK